MVPRQWSYQPCNQCSRNININSGNQGNDKLVVGNNEKLQISHIGHSVLPTCDLHKHIVLNSILCVPNITKNHISVSRLLNDNDIDVEFKKSVCFIKDKRQMMVLVKRVAREGLYELLCMLTHLSRNKIPYMAMLSSKSESIKCISNPVSMVAFSTISSESVNESSRVDKTNCSDVKVSKEIDL